MQKRKVLGSLYKMFWVFASDSVWQVTSEFHFYHIGTLKSVTSWLEKVSISKISKRVTLGANSELMVS